MQEEIYSQENPPAWKLQDLERAKKVSDAITAISDMTNFGHSGEVAEVISDALTREHRTLQQGIVGALLRVIVDYSKTTNYDARNEFAVKISGQVADALKGIYGTSDLRFPTV